MLEVLYHHAKFGGARISHAAGVAKNVVLYGCPIGHYIFALWFLLSIFYLLCFPRLISAVADWMSTILPHMVWPKCEFQMQV